MRAYVAAVSVPFAMAIPSSARAEDPATTDKARTQESRSHAIDKTWLYVDDARVAAPLTVIGLASAAYADVDSNPNHVDSPYRPLAQNTALPGALLSMGGEVGLLPRVSVLALGQMGLGGEMSGAHAGAIAGLRFQLSPPSWENVHIVASAGYLREAWAGPVYDEDKGQWIAGPRDGDNGAWAEAGISADVGRARLGMTGHGEHVFADGRDAVDLMFRAGASYRVTGALRLGVEWVGQDLEESFADAAERGARQFVGPTAALQLLQDSLTLVAGPALGLSSQSPRVVGRLAVAYGF